MWSVAKPSPSRIREFLASQAGQTLSYREVGASLDGAAPAGYDLDHNRQLIGHGAPVFAAACAALRSWQMFPTPWTSILPAGAPQEAGQTVAMLAHVYHVWWLNACRVVYVVDEQGPPRRLGFAYGTLPAHVEQGEERFLVEWLPDDSVWYDLRAFSRPRYWPARLLKPLVRGLQRRFVSESLLAMARAGTGT